MKKFTEQEQQAIDKYIEEKGIKKIPIGISGLNKEDKCNKWKFKQEDFQEFMMEVDDPLKRIIMDSGSYRYRILFDIKMFYEG